MKDPTSMTREELARAIADRIVSNSCEDESGFAHGSGWTLAEGVTDTLLKGHKATPLYEMTREELLVEWSKVMEDEA